MAKKNFSMGNADKSVLGLNQNHENAYNAEYTEYDINNINDSHSVVANMVNENVDVLDVGCATGIVGQFIYNYKSKSIDGIEIDKKAINIAKKRKIYNNIYEFSITDEKNKKYKDFFENNKKYDYILFTDVLEHLISPDKIIYSFSKKLKKNGKIIVSLPNANYIDIIRGLIDNEFNYSSVGLLDVTHLRFFTTTSFIQMIKNLNEINKNKLNVIYKTSIRVPLNEIDISSIRKIFDLNNNYEDYLCFQNIFEISIANGKPVYKDRKKVNNNYFEEINKYIENICVENENLKKENDNLKKENEKLSNNIIDINTKLSEKNAKLLNIYNSKGYKMLIKFYKVKDKIRKR